MQNIIAYLIRAGVGFYFMYPSLLTLFGKTKKVTSGVFACFNQYFPPEIVWTGWHLFFIFLGLMIAFWKYPLSWIILGILILGFKLYMNPLTVPLLLEVVPVLLVAIGLAIYYWKNEFGGFSH